MKNDFDYIFSNCLDRLEELVDLNHVRNVQDLQRLAFGFQQVSHVPTMIYYPLSEDEWPSFTFEEIYKDQRKMLLNELKNVYMGAKLRDDRLYGIRANYGTGTIASLFGCETRIVEGSMPIALHLSPDKLERILDRGPDLDQGLMPRVFETARYYRQTLGKYPKLSKVVGSQVFDIQGPVDNATIIWGADMYYSLYDHAEKIEKFLGRITDVIEAAVKELRAVDGCSLDEHDGDWCSIGGICIRLDSCINLSAEHYIRFSKPFDARLLEAHGGWIHFCGNCSQWWRHLLDIPNLKGINPHQGEFYDLYEMFEACEKAKVGIVQWTAPVDARCRERIKTGFSRIASAADFEDALHPKENLYEKGHADF